jgi:hypothetical protein
LEESSIIVDGRPVAVVKLVSGMGGGVLILVEILVSGIEPGETIRHHRAEMVGGD